jgi:hypothetical protein
MFVNQKRNAFSSRCLNKLKSNTSEKDKDLQPLQFLLQKEKNVTNKQTVQFGPIHQRKEKRGVTLSGRDGVLARFIQFNSLKSHA